MDSLSHAFVEDTEPQVRAALSRTETMVCYEGWFYVRSGTRFLQPGATRHCFYDYRREKFVHRQELPKLSQSQRREYMSKYLSQRQIDGKLEWVYSKHFL